MTKKLTPVIAFLSILLLCILSLFLLLVQTPKQKSNHYKLIAMQELHQAHGANQSLDQKRAALQIARNNLVQALQYDPYNTVLWIRLDMLQKQLFNQGDGHQNSQELLDVTPILKALKAKYGVQGHNG